MENILCGAESQMFFDQNNEQLMKYGLPPGLTHVPSGQKRFCNHSNSK